MKNRLLQMVHNIIAHPLMEILSLVGLSKIGSIVHDKTLPSDWKN
jgi:hypothetical protein